MSKKIKKEQNKLVQVNNHERMNFVETKKKTFCENLFSF